MHLLKRRGLQFLMITLVADALFFGLSDPARVSPLWLIAGYLLAVLTCYWLTRAVLAFIGLYIRPLRGRRQRLTRLVTLITALLLAMQSVGQLSLRDMLILLPLVSIAYLYFSYTNHKQRQA